MLLPDPHNKDLDSVVFPSGKAAWVTSVDIMPDGSAIVWLRNDDIPWVTLEELDYDTSRKQFILRTN